jgi:hypothetical protein
LFSYRYLRGPLKKDKESGQTFNRSDLLAVPGMGSRQAMIDQPARRQREQRLSRLIFIAPCLKNEAIGAGTVVRFAAAKRKWTSLYEKGLLPYSSLDA